MVKQKEEPCSFAKKCERFDVRLVSDLPEETGWLILVIARYDSKGLEALTVFPEAILRQALNYGQHRANELGREIRIVMEARLKDQFGGKSDLFTLATITPAEPKDREDV